MRIGSKSEYYHVEGALKLSRMSQSEWRRRWGVTGTQVFDVQVDASADDGYWRALNNSNNETGTFGIVGFADGANYRRLWSWFDPVNIPGGATVSAAYITVVWQGTTNDGTGTRTNIYFEDVDDAVQVATRDDANAKAKTTAFTAWDDAEHAVDDVVNSPDISAVIQEILDRPGWNSGQAMQLLWVDDSPDNDKWYHIYPYDTDTTKAIKLHVEYRT